MVQLSKEQLSGKDKIELQLGAVNVFKSAWGQISGEAI
jgi:hypothetical protein